MATRTSSTVLKSLDVLNALGAARGTLRVSEMSRRTGIHKSTVVRLCATLIARGYAERGAAGGYRLGVRAGALGHAYHAQHGIEGAARALLVALRDQTGESASFYVREGDERVCLVRENSRHDVRHHLEEGTRLPLGAGVVGRVLAAFSPDPPPNSAAIRRDGYLAGRGREPHTASVSAPVITAGGRLAGALVVSGPAVRFTPARQMEALKRVRQACAQLSGMLA
ncbi:MAG: IclR family transcriptional regulator [Betaproteobacteria bacterium]|nr:IclR family transcriptional regulator [Betaproteobacteria bacterium]